jgi:oligosaccharyl transferase (archaeosortase A-associated)
MQTSKLVRFIIPGVAVFLAFAISLFIRIAIPYDKIFSDGLVRFADPDCWYQIRLLDSLLRNFPALFTFDPYTYFPHGQEVFWHPFFTYLLAIPALLTGAAAAGEQSIYTISAYVPAVLGALAVIPVYFIGRFLVNRWAGIIAALLIAIMPGEFLHRSMLGFTDHHIAESLSIAVAFLFLILAFKSAKQNNITFLTLRGKNRGTLLKPVIYSFLAGIFLSIYLLTWVGGLIFMLFLLIYFVVQFALDHCRRISVDYLSITGGIAFFVALIVALPGIWESHYRLLYIVALPLVFGVVCVLGALSWFFNRRSLKPSLYPVTIVVAGGAAVALVYILFPTFFGYALHQFEFLLPQSVVLTITEAVPLLFPNGQFSFDFAWISFSLAFFLSLIAIIVLFCEAIKNKDKPGLLMLAVWSVLVLIAALGQRRFVYYYAVNVAVLCGYLAWQVFRLFGIREDQPLAAAVSPSRGKDRKKKQPVQATRSKVPNLVGAIAVVLAVFIYPVTGPLPRVGQFKLENVPVLNTINSSVFIKDSWFHTMEWLQKNTPEPFGDPGYYYKVYTPPAPGKPYPYPESAYGVMAWWDIGHMITQMARRIPTSNPHQYGAVSAAKFFTSQDGPAAGTILDNLRVKYILIDNATATTKFNGSIAQFAGLRDEDFFEMFYKQETGGLRGDYYFYPAYYQSAVVRLYNFDGQAVTPGSTTVITFRQKTFPEGTAYKEIVDSRAFPVYEQALDYANRQNNPNVKIVGTNAFVSPIPLQALSSFKLVHASDETVLQAGIGRIADVKVFEYKK